MATVREVRSKEKPAEELFVRGQDVAIVKEGKGSVPAYWRRAECVAGTNDCFIEWPASDLKVDNDFGS